MTRGAVLGRLIHADPCLTVRALLVVGAPIHTIPHIHNHEDGRAVRHDQDGAGAG
jgi:hypothetical protein